MLNKKWINILKKSKLNALAVTIMLLTIFFAATTVIADDFENTIVSVDPSIQTVSSEETFTIDVYCNPGQPIKSFEFKLSFDASLLQVNSVTEGNIFASYTTFFNPGTINNSAGSIVDIYGLITGTGNVTGNGTFVSISVTAKDVTGTSSIGLYGTGVTNETEYVPLEVNNGTVQVDATAPEFGDNSPSTGHTGDTYTFNVSVTDNVDIASELTVKVDWSHGSLGNNESMTHVGGNYFEKTIILDLSSISDMTYSIYAEDTCGNADTTTAASVTVTDNDNPSLDADNSDVAGTTGDTFNFDITASDNINVDGVNVSWSHGSLDGNLALSFSGGHWIGNVALDDSSSNLIYRVQVNDSSSNYVRGSQQSKSVTDNDPPSISGDSGNVGVGTGNSVTLWVTASDNIGISSAEVSIDGGAGNAMSYNAGLSRWEYVYTAPSGDASDHTYTVTVYDGESLSDSSGPYNIVVTDNDNPQITDISSTPSSQEIGGYVNITAAITDNIGVGDVFLNITYPDSSFENISITVNKTGSTYYCNKTYSMTGSYSYFIWADDTSNNSIVSPAHIFAIGDETPPEISNLVIIPSDPLDTDSTFGWVNITCDVTDNAAVDKVYLNITNPDESWSNVSMNAVGSDGYYYNSSTAFSQCGNFSYFIWANDTSGSTDISSSHDFSMPPNWDVNNDGSCTVLDLTLISNYYNESGVFGWMREDVDNNGEIKVLDLVLASNHYGETWWV